MHNAFCSIQGDEEIAWQKSRRNRPYTNCRLCCIGCKVEWSLRKIGKRKMDLMGNIIFKMIQNRIAQVRTRNTLGHDRQKMAITMCISVSSFHIYYSKLGFNWEKTAYWNINHSEQPTPDSKNLATINRTDNEPLFIKSMSRLINMFCMFIEREERKEDNKCLMKVLRCRIRDYVNFIRLYFVPLCC